jgi:ABC-type polysaccharide/polyol phosphate transport system ATPase subunit
MPSPSLTFDRVWKRFRRGNAHDSLRDLVPALARRVAGRGRAAAADTRDFWAVRDLSFTVAPGEVLGIIGGNGAGKSTVLKILNRIMEPTAGVVQARGKIGALIEVSAGFHQDLTGRQNVFLQGAIMGMRRAEVLRKFDQIVEFSGVADFIDTPVKRYSSGMNARLGFAIAAHLEPEILIIDEVLAVGDAEFQAKAFGRIKAMAQAGAPVVLVSHQLDRIAELCTKAILLDHGAVRAEGTALHCINEYLHPSGGGEVEADSHLTGIRFDRLFALDGAVVASGADLTVVAQGSADIAGAPASWIPAFRVVELQTGTGLYAVTGFHRDVPLPTRGEFEYHLTLQMNVPAGKYAVEVFVWDSVAARHRIQGPSLEIEVLEGVPFSGGVQMNSTWSVEKSGVPAIDAARTANARRSG